MIVHRKDMSKKVQSALESIWFREAKYKDKKTIKNKDGEETIVYEYSDRQVNQRNKEKSKKVEKIRQNIDALEKKIYTDLKGKENKLVALAVALINHTYERVGNDESASNGHYGVTGWKKKHLSFNGNKALLKYTGKSGVKHEKEITDNKLVSALKEISKDLSKEDCLLESISASDVNNYLNQFGITAKDIRGYHANREMQERLKALREENGTLPKDKKEKEKQLKEEFKEALDGTAKAVGHEEATLRKQYLVPHLEDTYMKDGTVITTLKKATSLRIAQQVFATKSESEKEDEEIERLQKPSPKKKPPRKDRSRKRMKVEDNDIDKDPDLQTKDMSMNYKIVGHLVRAWFKQGNSDLEKAWGEYINKETWKSDGKEVSYSTIQKNNPERAKNIRQDFSDKWKEENDEQDSKSSKSKDDMGKDLKKKYKDLSDEDIQEILELVDEGEEIDKEIEDILEEEAAAKQKEKDKENQEALEKATAVLDEATKNFQESIEKNPKADSLFEEILGQSLAESAASQKRETPTGKETLAKDLDDISSIYAAVEDFLNANYDTSLVDSLKSWLGEETKNNLSVEEITAKMESVRQLVDSELVDSENQKDLFSKTKEDLDRTLVEEASEKEKETKETNKIKNKIKNTLKEKFDQITQSEEGLQNLGETLDTLKDTEIGYLNEIVSEALNEVTELEKQIENTKDNKEKSKLKRELEEKKKGQKNVQQVKDILSVNLILKGMDNDEVSSEQRNLVNFLGEHSDTNSFEIQKAMSAIVSKPEGSTEDQQKINQKFKTQESIKTLMKGKTMEEKREILMSENLGDNKYLVQAFEKYYDQMNSVFTSEKKKKELEALADIMFSQAMSEVLLSDEKKDSGSSKSKEKSDPKNSKQIKEKNDFLNNVGQIVENLASFLVDNSENDFSISSLQEQAQTDISNQRLIQQIDSQIEAANDPEQKERLQAQKKKLVEKEARIANVRNQLVIFWGNI